MNRTLLRVGLCAALALVLCAGATPAFAQGSTTQGRGGTGLGLSVAHGIVIAHGGALTVDSRPGQGSTFHVYLPTVADADATALPEVVGDAGLLLPPGDVDAWAAALARIADDEVLSSRTVS